MSAVRDHRLRRHGHRRAQAELAVASGYRVLEADEGGVDQHAKRLLVFGLDRDLGPGVAAEARTLAERRRHLRRDQLRLAIGVTDEIRFVRTEAELRLADHRAGIVAVFLKRRRPCQRLRDAARPVWIAR